MAVPLTSTSDGDVRSHAGKGVGCGRPMKDRSDGGYSRTHVDGQSCPSVSTGGSGVCEV